MIIGAVDTCAFGAVTLGSTDANGVEWYFFTVDGWDAVQSTVQTIQRAQGDWGFTSPAYRTPRVFTITGGVIAPNRAALIAAKHQLNAAASIQTQPVTVTAGGQALFVNAQRQSDVALKNETDTYLEFSITFVAGDGRKFATPIVASTAEPSSTGGLTYPITYPVVYPAVQVTGVVDINNPGNLTGKVMLRVDGPCHGPAITHLASGSSLTFSSSYTLLAGNWLTIDLDNRTVLENDQSSRAGFVTSRAWFGLDPGDNEFGFNATSYDSGALLTVTAYPAYE